MSLINKFLQKDQAKEYFLTLGIEEHRICAASAVISGNQVTILGSGESEFRDGENEIEAADIAISTAEKNIPENILIKKVIFGLPVSFFDAEKIKPECAKRLNKICRELDFEPIGYVEYPQAINFYLENKEEAPPTLILLSIGRNLLILSLLRVGKVERNISVERTSSLSADFEKILTYFTSEILPSRIIIYDEVKGEQLEELREELLKFPWHKNTSFLHTPVIEILPDNAMSISLVEAAGSTLIKEIHLEEKNDTGDKKFEEIPPVSEEKSQSADLNMTFGFIKNKDIKEKNPRYETATDKTEKFHDIHKNLTEPVFSSHQPKTVIPKLPNITLPSLRFPSFTFQISAFTPIMIILGVILVMTVTILYLVWTYPKANVSLIVYPLTTSQQTEVMLTTDPKMKSDRKIITVNMVSVDVSGEKKAVTTGKTKVGEPSKGEVIVYNKTTASKTFPKGTILTNGSLKFTLDEEVSIASASDTGEGLTFGKTSAKVTNTQIGPEGNLVAGSVFSFKDFSQNSYIAKNSNTFSGGISREVSSVSKNDREQLLSALSQELETAARLKMIQEISPDEKLLDESSLFTVTSSKFSKEVNTEAKELSLTLSIQAGVLVYKESDLITLISKDQFTAPTGYTIDDSKIRAKIGHIKTDKKNNIIATAVLSANFLPLLDKDKIRADIKGKSFQDASIYFSHQPPIGGVEIVKVQNLPLLNNRLPLQEKNINIQVTPR